MLTVGSHDQVGRALELMREHGVSQVPVVSGEDGRAFMGTVSERGLLMASADQPGILGEPVTEVIEPPLPELAAESPVSEAIHMLLDERKPVIIVEDGRALGILASVDLIEALNRVTRERIDTRVVHAGLEPDPTFGSVIPPIHQTSTFVQPAPGEFVEDYDYSRSANPTRAALERALGELEGGHGAAFASGMAATHALLTAALDAGDHLILPLDLYGGTYRLVDKVLARFGLAYDLVDQRDLDALRAALRPETKLIWVETPTNPLLNVIDIAAVVEAAEGRAVVVDNTFATPDRPAAARARRDGGRPLDHQVPGRPLRRRRRRRDLRRRGAARARALRPELRRRGPGAVRLLPRPPRPAHAGAAGRPPHGERPRGQRVAALGAGGRGRPLARASAAWSPSATPTRSGSCRGRRSSRSPSRSAGWSR